MKYDRLSALESLEYTCLTLAQILRVTKKDGRVVIIDTDWYTSRFARLFLFSPKARTSLHVNPSVTYGPIRNALQVPELVDISRRIFSLAPLMPTCAYSAGPLWYRMCRDTKLLLKCKGNVCTVSLKDVKSETVAITLTSLKVEISLSVFLPVTN